MTALNNVEEIRANDPGNMYNRIFDLPEHLEDALTIGGKWEINRDDFAGVVNIVLIGMGGSAIGGDLVRSYLSSKLEIPFQVCRHYQLPEYVDDETLVIASSYSGNTEETLSALDDALNRKSMLTAISTGGMLNDVATLNEIPIAILPGGMQPRAALGYSIVLLLVFLERIGLVSGVTDEIKKVAQRLKTYRDNYIEDSDVEKNMAKKLARRFQGKIPIIYSGPTLTDAVAMRWKGQFCENSKVLAFSNQFSEFNHNELVGWSESVRPLAEHLIAIVLRDPDDHPQIKARMDFVKGVIENLDVEVVEIYSRGDFPLERMFSLIQLGDFVSYYLATVNGVDPTPVTVIEKLKESLSSIKST